jgi:hypothetical protein
MTQALANYYGVITEEISLYFRKYSVPYKITKVGSKNKRIEYNGKD